MRKIKLNHGILLTLLALVFTFGLTFASVELPRLVDTLLHKNIDFLDVASGQDELTAYKTELFLSHNHFCFGKKEIGILRCNPSLFTRIRPLCCDHVFSGRSRFSALSLASLSGHLL